MSISDEELFEDEDQSSAANGDTWIEELECALLADCDPATLKRISEGKRIPDSLRADYWRALLALNDASRVKLNRENDLENQHEIRQDCEGLVKDIEASLANEPLSETDKQRLKSDFETTLTTYVKARPELSYIPNNGWTDILRVLYNLQLSDTQLYQMFFRIVDRYIPKDLSTKTLPSKSETKDSVSPTKAATIQDDNTFQPLTSATTITETVPYSKKDKKDNEVQDEESNKKILKASSPQPPPSPSPLPALAANKQVEPERNSEKSAQAYHLLRLLIQYHDPELCSILDSKKITPNLYVKDWFCSLFARSCTAKLALLIWDTHFKMADPFLIFFAAIVMVVNASDELKKNNMSRAEMLSVLKSMPGKLEEDDVEDLYFLGMNHYANSTPRSLRSYSHLFFMDTFGKTYLGNESPEDGQPLLDLRTSQLTDSLDLSHYLCLPIIPAEIFATDTAQFRSSPTQSNAALRYFLVDCRPAEQYNAGHLKKAFHLDCSLMLREPSSFTTAVQALLAIQRQVVASKSNTGGKNLCFIGSGPGHEEEEDQYVNMVVASFLQKHQKYVSIVVGGFDAIHKYVSTRSELKDSFDNYIVDHNPDLCKACNTNSFSPGKFDKSRKGINLPSDSGGLSSAQSLFASTTSFLRGEKGVPFSKLAQNQQATAAAQLIAQSGASMFDKLTTAFASKSSVIKDRLVETLNTTSLPSPSLSSGSSSSRSHVSSQDKLGRRYTGSSLRYAIDEYDDDLIGRGQMKDAINEAIQEIQLDAWQKQTKLIAFYKCAHIKGNVKYPGFVALTKTHLWILREIPHNKGFATIAAKRPLDMIVQITSKRRQPDLIIFRYGYASQNSPSQLSTTESDSGGGPKAQPSKSLPSIVASDNLHIPQAFELIRMIKREIVRIMDENSRGAETPDEDKSTTCDEASEKKSEPSLKAQTAASQVGENSEESH